jgi:hypothetical protein
MIYFFVFYKDDLARENLSILEFKVLFGIRYKN